MLPGHASLAAPERYETDSAMATRTVTADGIRIEDRRAVGFYQEPVKGIVVYRLVGFASVEFFRQVRPDLEAAISRAGSIELFADAGGLEGYDARFRIEWVDWFIANKKMLAAIHVFVLSRLARMGVSVANLATGGMLKQYDSMASFDVALRKRAPSWKREAIDAIS